MCGAGISVSAGIPDFRTPGEHGGILGSASRAKFIRAVGALPDERMHEARPDIAAQVYSRIAPRFICVNNGSVF